MKRALRFLLLGTPIFALTVVVVSGQATTQIAGRVTDSTGAVLPGVEITLVRTETGTVRNAVTNETGGYAFPSLNPGTYRLEAALPGFRTFVQTSIVLQVGGNLAINPVLEVGEVAQTVEVQANVATAVETRSMSISDVIENERIMELPLAARDVTSLITLGGASASEVNVRVASGSSSMATGISISVAGVQGAFGMEYLLDGASATNRYDGTNMPVPFPDALAEFRVATSAQEALVGRGSAASVSQVTKSGTNDFHGNLFWFVRNAEFNAKEADSPRKNQLKRNQPGGTIGGPIVRDRLFFFYGFQSTITRDEPSSSLDILPTPAMLNGDWTTFNQCFKPRWSDADFADGVVDPARYSSAALQVVSRLPQTADPCGEIRTGVPTVQDEWQSVGRVDYQATPNQSYFGRYMVTRNDQAVTADPGNILTAIGAAIGRDEWAHQAAGGTTWVLNPNLITTSRFSYHRVTSKFIGARLFDPQDVGINMSTAIPGLFTLDTDDFFDFGPGNRGNDRNTIQQQIQIGGDTSWTVGAHQFGFGASWARDWADQEANSRSTGILAFDGRFTGSAMGDFLTGQLTSIRQSGVNALNPRQDYIGVYGHDTWRLTPRLTLNLGLRWDPFFPMVWNPGEGPRAGIHFYRFSPERFKAGQKSVVFPNAPAGFLYPAQTDGGPADFDGRMATDRIWNQFGPRAGLAWDPFGDGRTSIRAGYSIAYDVVPQIVLLNSANVSPWGADILHRNGTLDDPWQGLPGGNPFPFDFRENPLFLDGSVFLPFSADGKIDTPTIQSWNLSVQREIGNWRVSASYLGNQTTKLWVTEAANPSLILTPESHPGLFSGPDTCVLEGRSFTPCNQTRNINERRELRLWANANGSAQQIADSRLFSSVDFFRSASTANYHGLVSSVRGSIFGLNLNANYTWGHCISDRINLAATNPNESPLRPETRDRSNCSQADRRHIFNLTGVYATPEFSNPGLRAVASGWRVSVIGRMSSGQFLTITTGSDRALTGLRAGNQVVNQLLENVNVDESGDLNSQFLNRAAFAQPALGTIGNMGFNTVRGFNRWSLDAAVSRTFQFLESHRFEVRAEAFNLTNSTRPVDPSTNFRSGIFGRVTNAQDPRIMQFALKYAF